MRTTMANALIALANVLLHRIDPSIREIHAVRWSIPFGPDFRIPSQNDPCKPRSRDCMIPGFDPITY